MIFLARIRQQVSPVLYWLGNHPLPAGGQSYATAKKFLNWAVWGALVWFLCKRLRK